jgi:proteasome lid subunit RPN8/RPN11
MTIWARRGRHAALRIRRRQWEALVRELRRRGRGNRESGAFLLGAFSGDGRTVTRVVFFDDLDAKSLRGGIALSGLAFSKLWDICDDEGLRVLGDVHTHPSDWVAQSDTDSSNPMVARAGHVAVIVPDFAFGRVMPTMAGVHIYDGRGWASSFGGDAAEKVFVRRLL